MGGSGGARAADRGHLSMETRTMVRLALCPDGKCKARSPFSGSRLAFAFGGAESLGSSNFCILGPCLSDLVPGTLLSVLLGEGVY